MSAAPSTSERFRQGLERFPSKQYVVTRRAPSTVVLGRVVAGQVSTFTVRALVMEADGSQLARLPEGRRASRIVQVYSSTPLRTLADEQEADVIRIDDDDYEIQEVSDWDDFCGITHALAARVSRR
jgi:hypothetical protein